MRKLPTIFKLPNIFLTLSIVFLIMWLLFRWHYYQTFPKEKIDALFEPITSKYGIKIVYDVGDDFFSPFENPIFPAGPHQDSRVLPIRHRVLARYPDILKKAFEKYPVAVIKNYLKAIYFAGEIDHDGLMYGGTYDPFRHIIYLVDNGTNNDAQVLHTFHHEFSSLLLKSHSFWVNPWTDHNPKDFEYFDDVYGSWKEGKIARNAITDSYCYEIGFLTDYGLTNFENDFNEYSAMIFTRPQKFKKIMEQYPRVRGKFKVWLEFYQKIDPIFTEKYLFSVK
jgi:hypothetical protein